MLHFHMAGCNDQHLAAAAEANWTTPESSNHHGSPLGRISATISRNDLSGSSALYTITCISEMGLSWTINKSFSGFEKAHKAICKVNDTLPKTAHHAGANLQMPQIPRKRMLHSSSNAKVVQERTNKFQVILDYVCMWVEDCEPVADLLGFAEALQ